MYFIFFPYEHFTHEIHSVQIEISEIKLNYDILDGFGPPVAQSNNSTV